MVFASIPFLYFFLPAALILYFAAPRRAKNGVLLALSFAFYFYGEQIYVVVMIYEILVSYFFAIIIERRRGTRAARAHLSAAVIMCAAALLFFKYSDFFIESVNGVFNTSISALGLALPIGISFYTFQSISYVVDVYRGEVRAQKNIADLALYISMFPQLVAGPIVRYSDIGDELSARIHSLEKFSHGTLRFCKGLAKKVIIADRLYEFCSSFYESDQSVLFAWAYAAAMLMYVYFDFSGYSDMATGLGGMFGFSFPENFNHPLASKSVTEFWRRWHMTLGTWFRDYVYIPLGGSRAGRARLIFNLAAVWLLTGLWHGASWTFVIWGAYFGVLVILEKLFLLRILSFAPRAVGHIYLIAAAAVGFAVFGSDSVNAALSTVGLMFGAGGVPFFTADTGYYVSSYAVVLVAAAVFSTPIVPLAAKAIRKSKAGEILSTAAKIAAVPAVIIMSAAYFADGSFSPFLYFRF